MRVCIYCGIGGSIPANASFVCCTSTGGHIFQEVVQRHKSLTQEAQLTTALEQNRIMREALERFAAHPTGSGIVHYSPLINIVAIAVQALADADGVKEK